MSSYYGECAYCKAPLNLYDVQANDKRILAAFTRGGFLEANSMGQFQTPPRYCERCLKNGAPEKAFSDQIWQFPQLSP